MPGLLQFDPTGSFQAGRQNALSIQAQEQRIAREASAAPIRNQLSQLGLDQKRTAISRGEQKFTQGQAVQRAKMINQTATALKGIDPSKWQSAIQSLGPTLSEFGITPEQLNFTPENIDQFIAESQAIIGSPAKVSDLEQAQTANLKEKTATSLAERTAPTDGPTQQTEGLQTLIQDLSPELGQKAVAAFQLAGGGDKGVKALTKVIETGTEAEQRRAAPELLKSRFPQASPEEMQQLQSIISAAKNTETGFKEAGKLRVDQRKLQDFKKVKLDAARLLEGIIGSEDGKIPENSEWRDVVGSSEGKQQHTDIFTVFSDAESTAVADITQVRDMLTVDKLSIMSGTLTDKDIELLSNLAGGALIRTRDEDRFEEGVRRLIGELRGESVGTSKIDDLVNKYAN